MVGLLSFISRRFQRPPKVVLGPHAPPLGMPLMYTDGICAYVISPCEVVLTFDHYIQHPTCTLLKEVVLLVYKCVSHQAGAISNLNM